MFVVKFKVMSCNTCPYREFGMMADGETVLYCGKGYFGGPDYATGNWYETGILRNSKEVHMIHKDCKLNNGSEENK